MKKLSVVILIGISCYGCSKSSNVNPDPLLAETWPKNWILTIDHDATQYRYLHSLGIVIYRNLVDKNYSMQALASEKDCNWEVKQEKQVNGKTTYSFTLQKNKNIRWQVGKTASVNGTEEWYLGIHNGNQPPSVTDLWLFYLHKMPEQNGNRTYAIESAGKPGWFLHNSGHTLTANGVRVLEFSNPESATRFEVH